MFCTKCGSDVQPDSMFCPNCGEPVGGGGGGGTGAKDVAVLDGWRPLGFEGTGLQLLGWMALAIPCGVLIIPLAWLYAAIGRWVCRNLRFPDGTTAEFHGRGGEIVGWWLLYALAMGVQVGLNGFVTGQWGIGTHIGQPPFFQALLISCAMALVFCAIGLQIVKWAFASTELTATGRLWFTGDYAGFLGWTILVQLSALTIIGWAWALAGQYRWFARNTAGQGIRFRFVGKGHQILWRFVVMFLVMVLACGFGVLIGQGAGQPLLGVFLCMIAFACMPWLGIWIIRWTIEQIEFERF